MGLNFRGDVLPLAWLLLVCFGGALKAAVMVGGAVRQAETFWCGFVLHFVKMNPGCHAAPRVCAWQGMLWLHCYVIAPMCDVCLP